MKKTAAPALLAVEAALEMILETIAPVESEVVPLSQSFDRVLAQPVVSAINVPPFANSAMDGYAVVADDVATAAAESPVDLQVIDNIPAGATPVKTVAPQTCARIMTGAPLPEGANAVIRFEETSEYLPAGDMADDRVLIFSSVAAGDNVRLAGEDIKAGQTILQAGHQLRPQDVGVLAAIGQAQVTVYRRPRVAILATGDELVDVDEPMTPGKIRNSNEYVQAAMVEKYGGEAIPLGIARDNVADLTAKIRAGLEQDVDLFLTSAGVSVGDFDMVKTVLATEGEMQFWQVGIKPGKPLAFGKLRGSGKTVPLIGLPGNPVAAMVAFEVFARPAILKLGGHVSWDKQTITAHLDEDIKNSGRRHFMRAFVYPTAEGYRVTTRGSGVQVQGSGILSSMVWANGLVVVPETITYLPAETPVKVWILD
ncbi:MAG: molybdopterin molybdotransferase MoeA [Anaerolineae bacterium]|nr:molybdopterin molybdotransferase MoeA [Anaerolineae bacterium]MCB0225099.1 molybdopterin molybdotransferase MoeA [Anaerolineae bacterium]MCB9108745.1 molybdopterin molybdotransferase MoeA [Anaerolineales bacterium]